MNALRLALTSISLILLAVGYGASQWAFFWGDARAYAGRMDQPAVRWLGLGLLVVAIVFAFVPDRERQGDEP